MSQTNSPELHVGSNVYTLAGEKIGRLRFLMVDPDTASVSHLVLEKSSYVNNDVMIPTDRVGQVLNRGIYLSATLPEILAMEEFPESAYTGRHDRGERDDRPARNDRPERNDRNDRNERPDRDRGERSGNTSSASRGRSNKRYRHRRD